MAYMLTKNKAEGFPLDLREFKTDLIHFIAKTDHLYVLQILTKEDKDNRRLKTVTFKYVWVMEDDLRYPNNSNRSRHQLCTRLKVSEYQAHINYGCDVYCLFPHPSLLRKTSCYLSILSPVCSLCNIIHILCDFLLSSNTSSASPIRASALANSSSII